jgi:4,5-DOPA dioxygenase extradiol
MTSLSAFNRFTGDLKEEGRLMPVLFIGHGSPGSLTMTSLKIG